MSMIRCYLLLIFAFICSVLMKAYAQFSPPAGQPGSSAIHKDSSIIVSWATSCNVIRGSIDCSNTASPLASFGNPNAALGTADGLDVVSLGDGGMAVLDFSASPITDEAGWDFAVFENGFDDYFLELATVEASSDGIHYYLIPPTSLTQQIVQVGPFDSLDASRINNLAGKFRNRYGVPFDLSELVPDSFLTLDTIRFLRIKDVCGCIDCPCATPDNYGNPINDPFPTPFAEAGFDLDAVAVIHQLPLSTQTRTMHVAPLIYPNPLRKEQAFSIQINEKITSYTLIDLEGYRTTIHNKDLLKAYIQELKSGVYLLTDDRGHKQTLIITP